MKYKNLKNRTSLKAYFRKGAVPTENQFAELIDSVHNLAEDGWIEQIPTGWAFRPQKEGQLDIAFHTEPATEETDNPVWTMTVTPDKHLMISNEQKEEVIEVLPDKSVILHGHLKVDEEVEAKAFKTMGGGEQPSGQDYIDLSADKQWHNLPMTETDGKSDCRVFEIYASLNEHYVEICHLTRATAILLDTTEQKIESAQNHWWGWSGGIKIRWQREEGKNFIQIRSNKFYPNKVIHCRIIETFRG